MAESKISWRKGDFIRLGRAVSDFNKKVNRLQAEENRLYLPDTISYKEAKENITTRNELNRLVNSLRRFQREGAETLYTTQAGEEISKWERAELGIQSRVAQIRLRKELQNLEKPLESGYSRVQMGSVRAREIEAQIKNLRNIENEVGYAFKNLRARIMTMGKSDYTMKKATVFRENYMREMEKYSSYDNYDKLMKKLNSISSPVAFYEFVSQNEFAGDLPYQSDEVYTQEAFNSFLHDLGIETTDTITRPEYDEARQSSAELKAVQKQLEKGEDSQLKFREFLLNEKLKNSLGNIYNSEK